MERNSRLLVPPGRESVTSDKYWLKRNDVRILSMTCCIPSMYIL